MLIYDYFDAFERSLKSRQKLGQLLEPVAVVAFSDLRGQLRCDIVFWDGSKLCISETIDVSQGYPRITDYSYAYVRDEECLFRYDNAPHHPRLLNFPHHKHVGADEIPQACQHPKLSQVLVEIEHYLAA